MERRTDWVEVADATVEAVQAVRRLTAVLQKNHLGSYATKAFTESRRLTELCRGVDKEFCCSAEADDMEYTVMSHLFDTSREVAK